MPKIASLNWRANVREKLYLTIEKFSLRYAYFVFFDATPYLADSLFIRHKVRVWFEKEYTKEGSPYIAIFCHVRKRDIPEFLAALEDLKKSMLLCGYIDYEAEIGSLLDKVEMMKEVKGHGKTDPDFKTEQKGKA